MRKFFAAAMAAAMVLSMASVSFAATNILNDAAFDKALDYGSDGDTIKYSKTYDYTFNNTNSIDVKNTIEYGDTAYFPLIDEKGSIKDYKRVEKLKIKTEFEMGEDIVESVSIVKKPVKATSGTDAPANPKFADIVIDDTAFDVEWVSGSAVFTYIGDFDFSELTYLDGATTKKLEKAAADAAASLSLTATDFDTLKDKDGNAVSIADETTADSVVEFKLKSTKVESFLDSISKKFKSTNNDRNDAIVTKVGTDYYYFVAVKTKKVNTTADADVIGTFEFNRKKNDDEGIAQIKDEKHDFSFNVWYDGGYTFADGSGTTPYTVDDEVDLKWDDMYVLKFESDDEITINFGTEPNEGEFTVDASGQGKLLMNYNTNANEAIANANPGVKMDFVNFNGATFNRTGTFEYEMEDMVAAYKVVDDKLVEINGLEIDGDTATFTTRTLGNYVFANAELVNPAVEAPVIEAPVVAPTNPTTGGN